MDNTDIHNQNKHGIVATCYSHYYTCFQSISQYINSQHSEPDTLQALSSPLWRLYHWFGWPWHCQWCCEISCISALEVLMMEGEAERKIFYNWYLRIVDNLYVCTIHLIVKKSLIQKLFMSITCSGTARNTYRTHSYKAVFWYTSNHQDNYKVVRTVTELIQCWTFVFICSWAFWCNHKYSHAVFYIVWSCEQTVCLSCGFKSHSTRYTLLRKHS